MNISICRKHHRLIQFALLLLVASIMIGTATAGSAAYTITFQANGTVTPTGSFIYDAASDTVSSLTVHLAAETFQFTDLTVQYSSSGLGSCTATAFQILSGAVGCGVEDQQRWSYAAYSDGPAPPGPWWPDSWGTGGSGSTTPGTLSLYSTTGEADVWLAASGGTSTTSGSGTFTIAADSSAATPEPSTALLVSTLLGGLFLGKRLITRAARA
jgi:hypothetical protein